MSKQSDWGITYTGKKFYPLEPDAEDFNILDIAVGLSRECRFGNHCHEWYSVAEHSVLMYRYLAGNGVTTKDTLLWALLHDAPEGLFLKDIIRPIKKDLKGYSDHENRIMKVVAKKFGMSPEMSELVKDTDNAMLYREKKDNVHDVGLWKHSGRPAKIKLNYWTPDLARNIFLTEFKKITGDTDIHRYGPAGLAIEATVD